MEPVVEINGGSFTQRELEALFIRAMGETIHGLDDLVAWCAGDCAAVLFAL